MLKTTILFVLLLTGMNTHAAETEIRQTRADGTIDYAKPAWRADKEGNLIQLRRDGTPDYSKPRFTIQSEKIFPLRRDGTVDHSKSKTSTKER